MTMSHELDLKEWIRICQNENEKMKLNMYTKLNFLLLETTFYF